jgi:hypothetical protein
MPKVHLPDGRVVNFPDDMAPADIERAITEIQQPTTAPPEKTLAGFGRNVISSGTQFAKDTYEGAKGALKMAALIPQSYSDPRIAAKLGQQAFQTLPQVPAMLGAAKDAVLKRYGSPSAIGNTLYTDPVGAMGDLSTVAGLASGLGEAAGATRFAKGAGAVSRMTNPVGAVGNAVSTALTLGSDAPIIATLRPSAANRADFGGARQIAQNVKQERVYSEASAARKLTPSVAQADDLLAARQAAGVPGVPTADIADSVLGDPLDKAIRRNRLGAGNALGDLRNRQADILANNPREIPLVEAQGLKREAQQLAYEAGVDNQTVKKAAEQALAAKLRAGIEARVPEVGPINERSQRLLSAQRSFAEAEDRPHALVNMLALGAGAAAGASSHSPYEAVLTSAAMKALNSPRAGAIAGIGMDMAGKAAINPELLRAALLARLMGPGGGDQ